MARAAMRAAAVLAVALGAAFAAAPARAARSAPPPVVAAFSASPRTLPAGGGTVVLTARVRNARRCTFHGQGGAAHAVSCASGKARVGMRVAANPSVHPVRISFSVRAAAANRTAGRTLTVTEAGMAPPLLPLQIIAGELPGGSLGAPYSTDLAATGGTSPYAWTVVAGELPFGLTLSSTGTISGTPQTQGRATVTVQVADSTEAGVKVALATFTLTVAGSPLPAAQDFLSTNWSGYVESGGPFTWGSGTFTVPSPAASPSDTHVAEWFGIDGSDNTSLIQAGVDEIYRPSTSSVDIFAWWEILPDVAQPIPLDVSSGDQVTVTIGRQSAGQWTITVKNDTTRKTWSTTKSYSGPGTSAEWIVEAPSSAGTMEVETFGAYSPNVIFTGLGAFGTVTGVDRVTLRQNGVAVSTPSELGPAGFSVAYGATAPAPPG